MCIVSLLHQVCHEFKWYMLSSISVPGKWRRPGDQVGPNTQNAGWAKFGQSICYFGSEPPEWSLKHATGFLMHESRKGAYICLHISWPQKGILTILWDSVSFQSWSLSAPPKIYKHPNIIDNTEAALAVSISTGQCLADVQLSVVLSKDVDSGGWRCSKRVGGWSVDNCDIHRAPILTRRCIELSMACQWYI